MSYDQDRKRLFRLIGLACLSWGMVILEFCLLVGSIFISQALVAVISATGGAVFYTVFQNTLKEIRKTINAE